MVGAARREREEKTTKAGIEDSETEIIKQVREKRLKTHRRFWYEGNPVQPRVQGMKCCPESSTTLGWWLGGTLRLREM